MAYKINLQIDEDFAGEVDPRVMRAAARAALTHESASDQAEVTLAITDDRTLRRLNRKFLGQDHATDVLSFPSGEARPTAGARYLGDIAVSYPRAAAQAERGGHPVQAELQLLVVHGVLHLMGHDHARAAQKTRMWSAQTDILEKLKASITSPVE